MDGEPLTVRPLPWAETVYRVGEVYEIPAGPKLLIARCTRCDRLGRGFLFDVLDEMEMPIGWRAKH